MATIIVSSSMVSIYSTTPLATRSCQLEVRNETQLIHCACFSTRVRDLTYFQSAKYYSRNWDERFCKTFHTKFRALHSVIWNWQIFANAKTQPIPNKYHYYWSVQRKRNDSKHQEFFIIAVVQSSCETNDCNIRSILQAVSHHFVSAFFL